MDELLARYTVDQLDIPTSPGEWTIRQIVHHMADAHLNGFIRMKLVITENRPILKPYDQEAWAELSDAKGSIQSSLLILRGVHERWAQVLQDLPDSSWARTGIHLENGLVTLDDLLATYVHHGEVHLDQISHLKV